MQVFGSPAYAALERLHTANVAALLATALVARAVAALRCLALAQARHGRGEPEASGGQAAARPRPGVPPYRQTPWSSACPAGHSSSCASWSRTCECRAAETAAPAGCDLAGACRSVGAVAAVGLAVVAAAATLCGMAMAQRDGLKPPRLTVLF